jgi:hypothetical protein
MRRNKLTITIALVTVLLMVTVLPAWAVNSFPPPDPSQYDNEYHLAFGACSNNDPEDTAVGVAQFSVDVYPWGTDDDSATQALFVIRNAGPEEVTIKEVYFDDGVLLDIAQLFDLNDGIGGNLGESGVDFEEGADPPNLPAANCVVPSFGTLEFFASLDAQNPAPKLGIGAGESLGVLFTLLPDRNFGDLVSGLEDGVVRVGVHAGSYENSDGSETFVTMNATAIKLDSFNANANRNRVALNWRTGTEINNAGFNLYRSSDTSKGRVKINGGIIAAKGEAVSGASYSFIDEPGYGTYYYWLEDVEFTGKTTLHGPVKVTLAPSLGRPLFRPVLPGTR